MRVVRQLQDPNHLRSFRDVVDRQAAYLQALSIDQLIGLRPTELRQDVVFKGRSGALVTLIDQGPDGVVRVVILGFLAVRWLPWLKSVRGEGFYKHADGQIQPLTDEELNEFL